MRITSTSAATILAVAVSATAGLVQPMLAFQTVSFVPSAPGRHLISIPARSNLFSSVSDEQEAKSNADIKASVDSVAKAFQASTSTDLNQPIPYEDLTIGVMKETYPGENRVSLSPDAVALLTKEGLHVVVQSGAGEMAAFSDSTYVDAGAIVVKGDAMFAQADIIAKIRPPNEDEIPKLAGKTLVGMVSPGLDPDLHEKLTEQKTNVFALDCVPRMLSRAQTYDVLSSQANIAGYRAIVEAAEEFPRFFAGQMTAAGKVPPAKVLVMGAGVAGLAAIQTAKNMGAIVRAFDVRPVCKEQVESMGAEFLEVPIQEDGSGAGGYAKEMSDEYKAAQAAMMLDQAKDVDIIVTTALIPGREAPILVDQEMLNVMKAGSVCVDLAAANGGNVKQTKPNEIVTTENGVKIIGYTDLPSRLASTASNLVRAKAATVPSNSRLFPHFLNSNKTSIFYLFPPLSVRQQCCQIHLEHRPADHKGERFLSNRP